MNETIPTAVTGVDDLIRQVEAMLPPEKRSVGSFLTLATIARRQLDEALKSVFLTIQGDSFNLYTLVTNSSMQQLADAFALATVGEEVLKAVSDAKKSGERLDQIIATLAPLDPTAKPPATVAELFFYVPNAGVPYVPLYTAPYRFMSQSEAAWSVYTDMKGTFGGYMLVELGNGIVAVATEVQKAAVSALSAATVPIVGLAVIAVAYLYLTRSERGK